MLVMAPEPTSSPFQRSVVFTGRLASMKREEAFALVRRNGGTPRRGLTRKTGVLVVGGLGWPLLPDGRPSKSLALAKSYGVAIASERHFLEWAGRAPPDDQVKSYSAGQISSLSGLPLDVIEQLTTFGLLDGREQRFGFRDLTAARQLAELLAHGVALSTITRSLHEIRKWLPDAALSNLRPYPPSSDAILVEYMKGRVDKTGQFVLPVGEAPEDPDALFEHAQAAAEAGDVETAQQLYRRIMRVDPGDPAAAFNLGNLLRSIGRKVEAEAAYRAATKADPGFAEAWYNLADVLDEPRQADTAAVCLEHALAADPGYADAIFNLGMLHQRKERHAEAAIYWRRYLALDTESDWAAHARKALKYCEMQIAHPRRA
jgi:tetratricopeptide (TPR) repeat protein